jgi:hypothetical protein
VLKLRYLTPWAPKLEKRFETERLDVFATPDLLLHHAARRLNCGIRDKSKFLCDHLFFNRGNEISGGDVNEIPSLVRRSQHRFGFARLTKKVVEIVIGAVV